MTPITCACERCRAMCEHSTCLPTPAEAERLISLGYGPRMAAYRFDPEGAWSFVGPAIKGRADEVLPRTNMGQCSFYSDGQCELHEPGLKPLEGRIAHHDRDWRDARWAVMQHWQQGDFARVSAALNDRNT